MTRLTLFVAPYACSRVPTAALEEVGVPFENVVVGIDADEHKSPEFQKLNPKGKVPCLLVNDEPLTENVAILSWLHRRFPDAGLLPATDCELTKMRQIADLAYCAGGLHPIVTRIRMSHRFVEDPSLAPQVRKKGIDAMRPNADMINDRLADSNWWYVDNWSVIDAYLHWIWFRMTGAGFPAGDYPHWQAHYERTSNYPSVQKMLAREVQWQAELESRGAAHPP